MFHFSAIIISFLAISISQNEAKSLRIIGGQTAHINQFPYVAAINVQSPSMTWFCGGTLYENQWIITAAQCVNDASLFTIRLGAPTLNQADPNRIVLSTSTYFVHPDFDPDTLENDIAIIKLRMPLTFNDYIRPVTYLTFRELSPSTNVIALGWGQTSDDDSELSDTLQLAFVVTLSNDECKLVYGSQIKESMVCVEGNYNEGACHGDTGGPLILMHPRGYGELVGVSSFVSFNGCETTEPSGYTRLYPYLDWINGITGNKTDINQ